MLATTCPCSILTRRRGFGFAGRRIAAKRRSTHPARVQEFSAMGLPSSAAVLALSARKERLLSSVRVLKMAVAIGLRRMFAVQTKRAFFTRSLASVGL